LNSDCSSNHQTQGPKSMFKVHAVTTSTCTCAAVWLKTVAVITIYYNKVEKKNVIRKIFWGEPRLGKRGHSYFTMSCTYHEDS
jgi:hypothetical protein